MRVLIAGCGYVGGVLAERLSARGDEVWRLRRSASPGTPGCVAADVTRPETLADLPPGLEAVVYAVAADRHEDQAYARAYVDGPRNLLAALDRQRQAPRRFALVSSTGAYGQDDGSWVDEDTDPTAAGAPGFSGLRLLEGERVVRGGPFPATVLRLAGIYGPGRESRIDAVLAGRARLPAGPTWTNRIHRDDAAGALEHLLDLPDPAPLYLGVDEEPTEQAVFLRWLADRLSVELPPAENDTGRSRGNKRCRGDRLRASGYRFRYPSFREGYEELCRARGL